jgi:hypothetical protein
MVRRWYCLRDPWDGTVTATGEAVDFESPDFLRIEDGVAAEHWTRSTTLYQAFGLLPAIT